jgi:hypothetical protein
MSEVLVNLLSSALAGLAVWLGQRLLRVRSTHRLRRFLGINPGEECVLVVPRHYSSSTPLSVHRNDLSALVEVSMLIRDAGGKPKLVAHDSSIGELGRQPEFCIGGPSANVRAATHLRRFLPGVRFAEHVDAGNRTDYVGNQRFAREPGVRDYGWLARIGGLSGGRSVILVCGQTSSMNAAMAAYLRANHRSLARRHGVTRSFCLAFSLLDPQAYGTDLIELVGDVTAPAMIPGGLDLADDHK